MEQATPAPTVPVLIETRNGRATIEVLPDSGADICAAGFNFLHKLGENDKDLSESLISPRAVNGTKLQPVGYLRAKVYLGHRVTGDLIMGHFILRHFVLGYFVLGQFILGNLV